MKQVLYDLWDNQLCFYKQSTPRHRIQDIETCKTTRKQNTGIGMPSLREIIKLDRIENKNLKKENHQGP